MATNTVGIDKEVEIDRKENLRNHRMYWIGRRTQDVILSSLALVVLSPVMLATARRCRSWTNWRSPVQNHIPPDRNPGSGFWHESR